MAKKFKLGLKWDKYVVMSVEGIEDVTNCQIERHVVLVSPEIHWNTGNIGRTCLGLNAMLHLIEPLGFSLDNKNVKRAGLDYWHHVKYNVWKCFEEFLDAMSPTNTEMAVFSKYGCKSFRELPNSKRLFLIFGSETKGLPATILDRYYNETYYIPISRNIRCLNLSTAVGIALYESIRHVDMVHEWVM